VRNYILSSTQIMTSKTFTYDYEKSYTELINKIIDKLFDVYKKHNDFDITWLYDSKDDFIQEYVETRPEEAKEVIDKYGIFNAIRYYNESGSYSHGEFEIEDDDKDCYEALYYAFIDKFIIERETELIEKVHEKIKNHKQTTYHYKYKESYEQLVDEIIRDYYNEEEHKDDDSWYCDALHEVIDCYVSRYGEEAREVVEKYGVFKAIEEYENEYGKFEIDKCENCNYMKLYYNLINTFIMENYREKLESPPTEDE